MSWLDLVVSLDRALLRAAVVATPWALLAWFVARCLEGRPELRVMIWWALAAKMLLLLVPSVVLPVLPAMTAGVDLAMSTEAESRTEVPASRPAAAATIASIDTIATIAPPSNATRTGAPAAFLALAADTSARLRRFVALFLAALWLLGVGVQLAILLRRHRAWARLLRRSRPVEDVEIKALLQRLCAARGLPTVALRSSASATGILVARPHRPVILIGERALTELGSEELALALEHELLHIRRGDLWLGLVPALARIVFFFHPLAHRAEREYRLARELCCDAGVLARGVEPRSYGRLLLKLAVGGRPTLGAAAAAQRTTLERRLTMLTGRRRPLSRPLRYLAQVGLLVALVPLSLGAQLPETPAPAPQPVSPARPEAPVWAAPSPAPEPAAAPAMRRAPAAAPAPPPRAAVAVEAAIAAETVQRLSQELQRAVEAQVRLQLESIDLEGLRALEQLRDRGLLHRDQVLAELDAERRQRQLMAEELRERVQVEAARARTEVARLRVPRHELEALREALSALDRERARLADRIEALEAEHDDVTPRAAPTPPRPGRPAIRE